MENTQLQSIQCCESAQCTVQAVIKVVKAFTYPPQTPPLQATPSLILKHEITNKPFLANIRCAAITLTPHCWLASGAIRSIESSIPSQDTKDLTPQWYTINTYRLNCFRKIPTFMFFLEPRMDT